MCRIKRFASKRAFLVGCAVLLVSASGQAQITLISSWESASEITAPGGGGWNQDLLNVLGSSTLSIESTIGVTDGNSSLEVTHTGNFNGSGGTHFDRTAELDITDDQHPLWPIFDAVAQTPQIYVLEFDVTLDPAHIASFPPDTGDFDKFIGLSLWHGDSSGCCNDSNTGNVKVWGEEELDGIIAGGVPVTTHLEIQATRIGLEPNTNTFRYGFATNGNWNFGETTSFFFDNMFWREVSPEDCCDLNGDDELDEVDWDLFLLHHARSFADDVPVPTEEEAFAMGDLDGDLDNDFDDFQIFEGGWDLVNGPGSFQSFLRGVPEPSTIALVAMMTAGWACRRRRMGRSTALMAVAMIVAVGGAQRADAQLLYSWEGGLEGWAVPGYANSFAAPTIETSTIGATDGSNSIAITHQEDIFSWSMNQTHGSGAVYDAFEFVANNGPSNFALEFDVTYDTSQISGSPTFIDVGVALNNAGGWTQQAFDSALATTTGTVNETINVSQPLGGENSEWNVVSGSFHEIVFGFRGDWGIQPTTIFIDNLRITQTSTPAQLTLEVDKGSGATTLLNESGKTVDFDYYTIDSPSGALSPAGWNSLDDQNIDAVDGGDPGSIPGDSLLEGWDAGGGFAENLSEAFLLGGSSWADQTSLSLGNAYDASNGAEDLVLRFRDPAEPDRLRDGVVRYVVPPTPDGDFDGNFVVDGFDFIKWQRGESPNGAASGDLGLWAGNYGFGVSSAAGASAVPEPAAAILISIATALAAARRKTFQ